MVNFLTTALLPLERTRQEFRQYCERFEIGVVYDSDDLELIEAVTARGALSTVRPVRLYLDVEEYTAADLDRAAHQAVDAWSERVKEARRLYLQAYHHRRKRTHMTRDTAIMAGREIGPIAETASDQIVRYVRERV